VTAGSDPHLLQLNWKVLWNMKWKRLKDIEPLGGNVLKPPILFHGKVMVQNITHGSRRRTVANAPEKLAEYWKRYAAKQSGVRETLGALIMK
jgi:hypothetical protein